MPPSTENALAVNGNDHGNGTDSSFSKLANGYLGYDHVTWFVSNATQAASYLVTRMGFKIQAYRGLETKSQYVASVVVSNNKIVFVFTSAIRPLEGLDDSTPGPRTEAARQLVKRIHDHVAKHGDAVADVAFTVADATAMYNAAVANKAVGIQAPLTSNDDNGKAKTAVLRAFGDTTHTLVERSQYHGVFLPGYESLDVQDVVHEYLPNVELEEIDHCVGNQSWGDLDSTSRYYEDCLGFKRFLTLDDSYKTTEFSAMNSVVVSSRNETIKMPLNEPAVGLKKSQIEEFVKFHGGAGIQHIAFRTCDIAKCVTNLKRRGLQFIDVPDTYYADLRKRLMKSDVRLQEDLKTLQDLSILIDFDEKGYLLQIFSKPVTIRPTFFLEIIQRNNFDGFGAGNFKALFQAIEREQAKRGEL